MNNTEQFIKGSDNEITLQLLENGSPIAVSWTELVIYIGDPAIVTITRTSNQQGVTFTAGVLSIRPGALVESLVNLIVGRVYPVTVRVKDAAHTTGVYFGGKDSDDLLFFEISDPPG